MGSWLSLAHPANCSPFAFGSSYRKQHFNRPHKPDSREGFRRWTRVVADPGPPQIRTCGFCRIRLLDRWLRYAPSRTRVRGIVQFVWTRRFTAGRAVLDEIHRYRPCPQVPHPPVPQLPPPQPPPQPLVPVLLLQLLSTGLSRHTRWCIDPRAANTAATRRLHGPIANEAGRPSSVMRFKMLHAMAASVSWAMGCRARSRPPMIDLYRKKAFSTRACRW